MTISLAAPVLAPEERLQRLRVVVAEALDAVDEGDPYRLALATLLPLVPTSIAAAWCRRRPIAVERVVRGYARRLADQPSARPSWRDVVAVRHAAQGTARDLNRRSRAAGRR